MENNDEINMGDETIKFWVSWVTIHIMENAVKDFIQAWNSHRIPGPSGGLPNILAKPKFVTCIRRQPTTSSCIQIHEQNSNTHHNLSRNAAFGIDPSLEYPKLQSLRERDFFYNFFRYVYYFSRCST